MFVLRPLLWNIIGDKVLKLEVPSRITLIVYTNDLVVVTTTKTVKELDTE